MVVNIISKMNFLSLHHNRISANKREMLRCSDSTVFDQVIRMISFRSLVVLVKPQ